MTVSFVWNSLWSAFAHVSWKKNKQAESRVFCAESVQNNSPNEIQRKFMQYVQCVCEYMVLMYCWLDLCHAYLWDCFQPTPCSILLHPPPPNPPSPTLFPPPSSWSSQYTHKAWWQWFDSLDWVKEIQSISHSFAKDITNLCHWWCFFHPVHTSGCCSGSSPPPPPLLPSLIHFLSQSEIDNFEGSQPEWCISSMIYIGDTPFWSETLNLLRYVIMLRYVISTDTFGFRLSPLVFAVSFSSSCELLFLHVAHVHAALLSHLGLLTL